MNAILKRVISLMLCFVLLVGYVPVSAFATESGETVTAEATDVTTAPIDVVSDEPEAPSESTEAPTDPSQETTAPTDATTAPTDATTAPTDATTAPTDAPTEPTDATTAPTEAATVPTEAPTEPEEEDKTEISTGSAVTVVKGGSSATVGTTATAASTGEAKVTARTNTDTSTDYLFIATDRHANTSIIGDIINNMESDIGENELDYLGLGGDMVGSGNSHPAYNSSTVLGEATGATSSLSAANVDIVAGIHDMNVTDDAGIVLPYQGGGAQIYEGDRFYVYGVPESCISGAVSGVDPETEANDFVTWANGSGIDKSKVIIVLSHYPLHQRRNDNDGAVYWAAALNTVAAGDDTTIDRDVAFFWGHNHTGETNADTAVYHKAPGSTISVQGGSSSQTIYFTYANAGYLNAKSSATLVNITDEKITFDKYVSSSVSTTNTVTRVKEAVTLSSIAITTAPTKTAYTVGETLDTTGMVVTATYSDTTTEAVTGYTVSDVDMTTAGTKTVTVTYEGKTATFDITVSEAEAEPAVNTVECWDDSEQVTVKATGLGLTAVTATNVTGENKKCDEVFTTNGYMAFDIALTGLVEGQSVEYSISVVPDLDITNLELYYIDENGELIPVECKLTTDELNNVYVEFTTDKVGTFVYGSPVAPEGYVLTFLVLANIPTDVFLGTSLKLDETAEVTATYTKEGAEDFVRKLTIYDYDADNFSGIDVNVSGKQTATFTFEGVSVTHDIYVWGDSFTTSGVTVALDKENGSEYGVTGATVADSLNENVATAIADVIDGNNYVAYDISLTYSEGYEATENTKTVTLPIPEGVTNPVVYYVSDDGQTVTNMEAAKTEDGKSVTFTTDHFSTYVVGNSSTLSGTEKDQFVPGNGTTITKNVWKLTNSLTNNGTYLIVNTNAAGDGYALLNNNGSIGAVPVTVVNDGTNTYIELDNANAEWAMTTASGNDWMASNNGKYLVHPDNSLSLSTTGVTWASNGSNLYYNTTFIMWTVPYYLTGGSSWSVNTDEANVYFYTPATITTTTGTVDTTYHMDITYNGTATQEISAAFIKNGDTLQLGATITPSTPANGSYTVTSSNTNVATVDNSGLVTFTGTEGETLIQVTYTWDENGQSYTVSNYASIDVTGAIYDVEISQDGTTAAPDIIAQRNVQNGTTLELKALTTVQTDETTTTTATPDTTTWYAYLADDSAADSIASIDQNGKLTFTGVEGTIKVMVVCKFGETTVTDFITINVRKSNAVTPDESTTDFPRWPNEGAVRYDKTAQAVGNFSNTGVAQVELSLAGIPQKTGGAVDVVIMLDMTGSMSSTAMTAAEESAIAFAKQIVQNSDGTFNDNRISVMAFNSSSSSPFTYWEMGTITADEWDGFCTAVRGASDDQKSGGTPYDEALEKCQSVLEAARTTNLPDGVNSASDYKRSQFCVFVSDGGPTSFEYITNYDAVKAGTDDAYTTSTASASGGSNQKDSNFATIAGYDHEYYSTMMKDEGVTMYSVLTGLEAASWPNCTNILRKIASDDAKAYVVPDGSDTTALTNAFTTIAEEIKQAASQIEVSDKITDEYEMIFQWPDAVTDGNKVSGQEFYIEVVNYELDADTHERNGTYDVLTRVYLTENSDGTLAISKLVKIDDVTASSAGTTTTLTTTPAYTAVEEGKKGYFNLVDGTYVYVADGTGGYNMTEGATVSGSADTVVLHTPYFSYEASTKVITWHITETAENSEIALRYFLYLTGSLESVAAKLEEGDVGYVAPGTYPTNDYATLEYKNYKGNDCLQYFPEPQLTWNGAQVSYVFYLVNSEGKPVNTAGREVKFSEAVFVTSIHTEAVVWNEATGTTSLNATKIADELLPDSYKLYDATTQYKINVYMDESDHDLGNHFVITAGGGTTMVYNTKAGTKYSAPDTYNAKNVETGFDFANTTVAFAVVWEKKLVEDTVVVDFGLPVNIDVATNDFVYNSLTAIGTDTPSAEINTGTYEVSALSTKIDTATGMSPELALGAHKAQIVNEKVVRFIPGSMEFNEPVTFNYETATDYYENSKVETRYMYSTVTVIPATTIYYEDSFVTLESYSKGTDGTFTKADGTGAWTTEGTTTNATQDQDRPGASQISAALDADNNYGYDSAYVDKSTHSLGSAAKITVDENTRGEATFTFYGTGFDIIGLTSDDTGMLIVEVFDSTGKQVKSSAVDTYYGYAYGDNDGDGTSEWYAVTSDSENALYQVPVMKISGLTYGKYTAKLTAGWNKYFDHVNGSQEYDLYLDAIRIYDPTGNKSDVANNAYAQDGEAHPEYTELRDLIISADTFDSLNSDTVSGVVFIDGMSGCSTIKDYTSYGPNNELYLAAGQAVAGVLDAGNATSVQLAIKTVGGTGKIEVYGVKDGTTVACLSETISSATDMYYDITALNGMTLVVKNAGSTMDAIVSITNIKCTYGSAPVYPVSLADVNTDEAGKVTAQVTYSNNTSKTVEVVETSVTNEDGSVTYTYTYTEKVNSLTYTVSVTKTVAADSGVATASETSTSATSSKYLLSVNRSSVNSALATMNVEEDTVPETSVPETSEPETYEPETSEPETSEPETSVPEETEPETGSNQVEEAVKEAVKNVVNTVKSVLKKLFNRWFR